MERKKNKKIIELYQQGERPILLVKFNLLTSHGVVCGFGLSMRHIFFFLLLASSYSIRRAFVTAIFLPIY